MSIPMNGNGTPFDPQAAVKALETIKNMGTEQEQREAAEYLQRVLHEYQNDKSH
jgi:hypothetical protein